MIENLPKPTTRNILTENKQITKAKIMLKGIYDKPYSS